MVLRYWLVREVMILLLVMKMIHQIYHKGAGDDYLVGGAGDDVPFGGTGNNLLAGGIGNNIFIIEANNSDEQILDFSSSDKIIFKGFNLNKIGEEFPSQFSEVDQMVIIQIGNLL